MIKRVEIRNVASFDNKGVAYDNLQKVNVIFGSNGCGKTTTGRVLGAEYEEENARYDNGMVVVKPGSYSKCRVFWDGKPMDVLVYSQDFREECLDETIPGLYELSHASIMREVKDMLPTVRVFDIGGSKIAFKMGTPYAAMIENEIKRTKQEGIDETFKPDIDDINNSLKQLGYSGFSIQPTTENSSVFQIQRKDGKYVDDSLSEGEASMISFLLFMQMVKTLQKGKDRKPKVIVIDDPISSMDYASIEVVSNLTNRLIEKARKNEDGIAQVIVLTHNTSYHKCLNVNQERKDTFFWKLSKKGGISCVEAFEKKNPVSSDYAELWTRLREARDKIKDGGSESPVYLQGLMRRIVETYFLMYGRFDRDALMDVAIYKDNSGGLSIKTLEKFKELFVKLGHEAHYKMMMREEMDYAGK